ncbi:MAG: hypothetical protein Kow0068_22640 [Marinilabiliales bacterium]
MHKLGVKIILHCFEYNREQAKELNNICKKVFYYKRSSGFIYALSKKPYIIKTRESSELLINLKKDNYPVLFEGLHTTAHINHPVLKERLKLVRTHNIEHQYYKMLQRNDNNLFKQFYFKEESKKLENFEKQLLFADHILAISRNDYDYFNKYYGKTHYIPAFHPNEDINIIQGRGKYILYHGNLSVPENIKSVIELTDNVFSKTDKKVIIAGRNPHNSILKKIKNYNNISLISNPDDNKMNELIRHAQIIILTTNQNSGIKLKLLSSLFAGRHCIVNDTLINNTGLEHLCTIKNTYSEILEAVDNLWDKKITEVTIEERRNVLMDDFSNIKNAQKIMNIIA